MILVIVKTFSEQSMLLLRSPLIYALRLFQKSNYNENYLPNSLIVLRLFNDAAIAVWETRIRVISFHMELYMIKNNYMKRF